MTRIMPTWLKYTSYLVSAIAGGCLGLTHLPFMLLAPIAILTGFLIYWLFDLGYSIYWSLSVDSEHDETP